MIVAGRSGWAGGDLIEPPNATILNKQQDVAKKIVEAELTKL